MAIQPNPDYDAYQMILDHGTVCLITNPIADYYLEKSKKQKKRYRKINKPDEI